MNKPKQRIQTLINELLEEDEFQDLPRNNNSQDLLLGQNVQNSNN